MLLLFSYLYIYSGSLLLLPSFHLPRELVTTPPILPYTQRVCYNFYYSSMYSGSFLLLLLCFHIIRRTCYSSYASIYSEELVTTPPICFHILRELVTTPPICFHILRRTCYYSSYMLPYTQENLLLLLLCFHIIRRTCYYSCLMSYTFSFFLFLFEQTVQGKWT